MDQKARMGLRTDISSIAFDTVFQIEEQQSYIERVLKSTVNWSYTNWKGMTFGILFGASLLSVLRLLPLWRLPDNGFLAALQGLIGGAPLGVCVNCATPIAQGLQRAGVRLETMLAVMTASPTLNLIVITMMFSLFSIDFVLIKLGVTLFFITVLLPAVVWLWSTRFKLDDTRIKEFSVAGIMPNSSLMNGESWLSSLGSSMRVLLKNLFFLLKMTLPLMLLAGLLGALLIESISLESIANLPSDLRSYILIAVIGVFLPVPIAFDVVITSALMSIGLPVGLAMTLFFSLSIFSIFPALIIGRDVSWSLSALLICLVIIVSILAGFITEEVHQRRLVRENIQIEAGLTRLTEISPVSTGQQSPPSSQSKLSKAISLAMNLCMDNLTDPGTCMNELLTKKTFGTPAAKLCAGIANLDPALGSHCMSMVKMTNQSKAAIRSGDISLCTEFKCRMAYLKANSHKDNALSQCELNVNAPEIQLCRLVVLNYRIIHFRSNDACKIGLNNAETQACQSEVKARIAMEQMDIGVCRSLADTAAKMTCLYVISALRIQDYGDEFDCHSLPDLAVVNSCTELQKKARALKNQSFALCNELKGKEIKRCQIDIIDAKVLALRTTSLPELKNIGPSFLPKIGDFIGPVAIEYQALLSQDNVHISVTNARPKGQTSGKFERHHAKESGLQYSWNINATDFFEPFRYGKGISSGDVNKDGYPDIAIAFERGIHIYFNRGDGTFALAMTLIPDANFNAFVTALVDLNNDGWLDLFASSYGGSQYIFLNRAGQYKNEQAILLASNSGALTMAAAFADLDQDSDLDMVLGKWSHGIERHFRTHGANNELWLNESGALEKFSLFDADPPGSTLTILLSDLNGDSIPDIVTGNDRQVPDIFYFSEAILEYAPSGSSTIPQTSLNTMSYDSADFNNDLKLDIFSSDMTFVESGKDDYCADIDDADQAQRCRSLVEIGRQVNSLNIDWCSSLTDKPQGGAAQAEREQAECLAATILKIAIRDKKPELCTKIPPGFPAKQHYCQNTAGEIPADAGINISDYPAQLTTNKYLMAWGNRFLDVTEDAGVARSNWSWNARGFDADNDGYQDIFVGTGYGFGAPDTNDFTIDLQVFSNVLFHNNAGTGFSRAEDSFGAENYINTSTYTLTDYDLDGDLDIIEYGQGTGISILENRLSDNNTVTFVFDDERGNRACIGCKIIIETASGKQIREIKASGGFMSFDEPLAQFGLGADTLIKSLEIHWSTGEKIVIEHQLEVNKRYKISRR